MERQRKFSKGALLFYDKLLHSISSFSEDSDGYCQLPVFQDAFRQKAYLNKKKAPTIPVPQSDFFQHCKDTVAAADSVMDVDTEGGEEDGYSEQIWKCDGVGMQPIVELPDEYVEHFASLAATPVGPSDSAFYMSVYTGSTGVWFAVLFAVDSEFIMRTFKNQQNCVVTLKQQMNSELDDHYTKYKYRQYGYSKADMHRVLMNTDTYHLFMGHYLSDFLQVNIAVLLPQKKFHWLGRFDEGRVTICLCHKGTEWCPVVHADGKTHLFKTTPLRADFEHLAYMDSSKQHLNLNMDKATLTILKREIKAMKLRELQDRAVSLELLIQDAYGKQKLKSDLQNEVFVQMTGCESMKA
jgi:hypothetical protein